MTMQQIVYNVDRKDHYVMVTQIKWFNVITGIEKTSTSTCPQYLQFFSFQTKRASLAII